MILRRGGVVLAAILLVSACAADGTGPGGPASPAGTAATSSRAVSVPVARGELLEPVAAYVEAVNTRNLDALVAAFAPDGEVVDVGRRFAGRDAIRGWADREVIGGALTVTAIVERRVGYQKPLVTFAPGGTGGFAAHYAFTVSGPAIARADLTYAN